MCEETSIAWVSFGQFFDCLGEECPGLQTLAGDGHSSFSISPQIPFQPRIARQAELAMLVCVAAEEPMVKGGRNRDGAHEGKARGTRGGSRRCEDGELPPYLADSSLRRRSGKRWFVRWLEGTNHGCDLVKQMASRSFGCSVLGGRRAGACSGRILSCAANAGRRLALGASQLTLVVDHSRLSDATMREARAL